jgi:hypothetical protein
LTALRGSDAAPPLAVARRALISHATAFSQTPSSATLLAATNPSSYGQPVTFTAIAGSGWTYALGTITFARNW